MLLLLFQVGENWYAIDTERVIEIVPRMLLRKIESASPSIVGVFNYHGQIVPVMDLCCVIHGKPCQVCYSSRVILVEPIFDGEPADPQAARCYLGLLVERVTETLKVSAQPVKAPDTRSSRLGELLIDERGVIEKVNWEQFVMAANWPALLAGEQGPTNGAERN